MGLLIDSTVLVAAERASQGPAALARDLRSRFGDAEVVISVMTAAELFHGCWRAANESRRARRKEFVESIVSTLPVLPVTVLAARVFGEIDARLRATGMVVPTSDLLIACTALSRGDDVVTGNARHFRCVPGLRVHVHPEPPASSVDEPVSPR